jgi:ABC-type transporter Mla maintaining outer membrane lipid asymmetry ATPase subunit MlaF
MVLPGIVLLLNAGLAVYAEHRVQEAIGLLDRALQRAHAADDQAGAALVLTNLGMVLLGADGYSMPSSLAGGVARAPGVRRAADTAEPVRRAELAVSPCGGAA